MNLIATSTEKAALATLSTPVGQAIVAALGPTPYLFSVAQYRAMHDTGIFQDVRVELLEGRVVEKMSSGEWHAFVVRLLNEILSEKLRKRATLGVQDSVVLSTSMPEPDVAVFRYRADLYRYALPTPADSLLYVEVADTSLTTDRGTKLPIYARAGIPEYWIVSREDDAIEVCRDPAGNGIYASRNVFDRGKNVSLLHFPDVILSVDEILGPPDESSAEQPQP